MKEEPKTFMMAGGGTGGHVIPAIAVARELRDRGHRPIFAGTSTGFEAKLVPQAGFEIATLEIGGLNRVGVVRMLRTLVQLPVSVANAAGLLRRYRPAAIFSMGGYVAGPLVLAAIAGGFPIVAMEPNAMPGLVNRRIGRFVSRALLGFPETARWFAKGRTEVTGLPVRPEFFAVPPKPRERTLTVLITGGSQGSRTLNEAARAAWPLISHSESPVRFIHQTGAAKYESLAGEFAAAGVDGEITPFIQDMAAVFARVDLVVCRAGAGAIAELAAAGKPSILVPLPFAADDHQRHNAQAFERAGAARLVLDKEMTGQRLVDEIQKLAAAPGLLEEMGRHARSLAHPGAALRAADVLEEVARGRV
ncbi:MAG: undecaprenyldiphospho-muramoylpentapeptide beta-N-acetylglucosaminyltransferase [Acidobacteriota bacterium]|nr:undecaprenyldiphospho-muramoylpentapeptide beta-N-acetylglucosaminyltransferase [Acidobacteriota bacterium]